MNKNRKGQLYNLFFWILLFIIFWSLFFGQFFNEWGQRAILNNNMVGIEALLMGNFNLFIGICLLLVMFVGFGGLRGNG